MASVFVSTPAEVVVIDSRTRSGTITLPTTNSIPNRVLNFKDQYGTFSNSTLTLSTQLGESFDDGTTTKVFSNAFTFVNLYAVSSKWLLLGATQTVQQTISSLTVNQLNFGTGSGWVQFGPVQASIVSTIQVNTNDAYTNNLFVGGQSTLNDIMYWGLQGNYNNTVLAEISTGAGTQEFLVFKGSSTTDRVRVQTTGTFVVETGVSARLFNSNTTTTLSNATPAFIINTSSNVGIQTANPGATLDVNGTARALTLSTQQLNISSLNGFIPIVLPNLQSTVAGLQTSGQISTPNLISTVAGLGSAGYVSTTFLNASLASTTLGLASAGYVTSSQLVSTTFNLVETPELLSSITGLGSIGYVSTSFLNASLASTTLGLASAGYVISSQLISTTAGLIDIPELLSSITGLGSAGYVSSTQLASSISGLTRINFLSSLSISTGNLNVSTVRFIDINTQAQQLMLVSSGVLTLNGQAIGGSGSSGSGMTISDYVVAGKLNASQLLTPATDNDIQFVDDYDPQNWYNPATYRLAPTIAGYYIMSYQVWFQNIITTNDQINIQIQKNGVDTYTITQLPQFSTVGTSLNGTKIIYMNGTDYVKFRAYVGNSSNTTVVAQYGGTPTGQGTYFTAALLTNGSGGGNLISTTVGLGSIGYISTSQLVSTFTGIQRSGFISTPNLLNLVSTPNLLNLVSTPNLLGLVSTTFLDVTLQSTTTGISRSGFISSPNLLNLVSTANLANLVSTPNLLNLVSTPNLLGLVSTTFLDVTLQSTTTGISRSGFISSPNLLNLVSTPNLLNLVSTPNLLGLVSTTFLDVTLQSTTTGISRSGFISSPNLLNLVSTPNLLGLISSPNLISTTAGLETYISSFIDPRELASSIQPFISVPNLLGLVSTPNLLNLVSTQNLLGLVSTPNLLNHVSTANLLGLVSTPNLLNLVSTTFLDTTLQSTTTGISRAGFISSPNLLNLVSTPNLLNLVSTPNLLNLVSTTFLDTTLQSTTTGISRAGFISSPNLLNLVSTPNLLNLVSTQGLSTTLYSTIISLGSIGYISTSQLTSTVAGIAASAGVPPFISVLTLSSGSLNTSSITTLRLNVSTVGTISSLIVNSLQFGDGTGWVNLGPIETVALSSVQVNTNTLYANTSLFGNTSTATALQMWGLFGNYNNTVIAEFSTGVGTQELLLFKGSSTTDRIRMQTTGTIAFEPGVSARLWSTGLTTMSNITPAMIINTSSNVGIQTANPGATLDVNGTARSITLSSQQLFVSSVNGTLLLTGTSLISTVTGLGSAGYISSAAALPPGLVSTPFLDTVLQSTTTGISRSGFLSSANLLNLVSTPNLLNLVSTQNLLGLVSTTFLDVTLQSTTTGIGRSGFISSANLLNLVSTPNLLNLVSVSLLNAALASTTLGQGTGGITTIPNNLSTMAIFTSSLLASTIVASTVQTSTITGSFAQFVTLSSLTVFASSIIAPYIFQPIYFTF